METGEAGGDRTGKRWGTPCDRESRRSRRELSSSGCDWRLVTPAAKRSSSAPRVSMRSTWKQKFSPKASLLQRVVLVRKIGGLSNRDNNVPVPRNSPFRDGSGPFPLSRATSRLTRKSGFSTPSARLSRTDRARPLSQALPLPSEILLPDNG